MTVDKLIKFLSKYSGNLKVKINHPEGDWLMVPESISEWESEDDYLLIRTDFDEDDT